MSSPNQLQFFAYQHLPPHLQTTSKLFGELAQKLDEQLPDNPEKGKMLDALMVAKDCAARANLWVDAEFLVTTLALIKANEKVVLVFQDGSPVLAENPDGRTSTFNVLQEGVALNAIIPQDFDRNRINAHAFYSYDNETDEVVIDWTQNSRRCRAADFIYGRLPK